MINIILCGGSGTRLWPLSRTKLPKQFVRMFNDTSLFQNTLVRNQGFCSEFFVVSNKEQFFLAEDQLTQVVSVPHQFLLEPVGRNTAPAIALACLHLDEDDLVLVTPSDHLIKQQSAYEDSIELARKLAQQGHLVTFGIQPGFAETGFGYIEAEGNDVLSFKEKPDQQTAQQYVDSGNYYWNSGMFCFKAGVFLEELKTYSPEMYKACYDAYHGEQKDQESNQLAISMTAMLAIPEDSIDYAVMEKSQKVKVVPCDIGWSDMGSFDALQEEVASRHVVDGNALLSRGEQPVAPIFEGARDNLVVCRDRAIAMIDVDNLLVVDTADAVLISRKGSSQKVKQVVAEIKKRQPELAEIHRIAYRPWGTYEVLLDSERYKIKRIVVKPGHRLSLQKHFHRNEHWIVVSGTATVTVEEETRLVRPNESTYINMGELHRLENDGKIDLVMIEVQVGEYTGEDDIVRVEDVYGR